MALITLLVVLGVVVGGVVLAALLGIGIYNKLVTLRNRFKNAFAQIDVQLKRRYDLIPNLVETAKAYMKHEAGTLERVVQARSGAVGALSRAAADPANAEAIKGLLGAEAGLGAAMRQFMVTVERYPDLKANQTMATLMEELTSTENRVSFARQAYNDAAMGYNTARETFPGNLVAGFFNFAAATYFEVANEAEREAVKVQF